MLIATVLSIIYILSKQFHTKEVFVAKCIKLDYCKCTMPLNGLNSIYLGITYFSGSIHTFYVWLLAILNPMFILEIYIILTKYSVPSTRNPKPVTLGCLSQLA